VVRQTVTGHSELRSPHELPVWLQNQIGVAIACDRTERIQKSRPLVGQGVEDPLGDRPNCGLASLQAGGEQGCCAHDDNEHDRTMTSLSVARADGALVYEAETQNVHDYGQRIRGSPHAQFSLQAVSAPTRTPHAATANVRDLFQWVTGHCPK
jgi:hypothetical protein